MDKQTEGIIVSVKKQWWLSVRTKPLKTGPLDGTIFPHIMKVKYTVDGKNYDLHYIVKNVVKVVLFLKFFIRLYCDL